MFSFYYYSMFCLFVFIMDFMGGSPRQPLPCDHDFVCMDPLALCLYRGENTYISIKNTLNFL